MVIKVERQYFVEVVVYDNDVIVNFAVFVSIDA